MEQPQRRLAEILAMVTLVLLLMACGGESDDEAPDPGDVTPSDSQPTLTAETPGTQSGESGADFDADGDGYYVESELRRAIRMTFGEYDWPDDYTTTADAILEETYRYATDEQREGSPSQVGMEHTLIGGWHECAWYMTWLDAFQSGVNVAQAEALQVMTNVFSENPSHHESTRDALGEIAQAAALGAPSLVQRHVGLRCADLPFDRTLGTSD
ncbi:MAG: hypothetical protein M3439_00415 [Chloroflexota bacterium]|nr:hypothetical protein [Chloroflexota bacterium]